MDWTHQTAPTLADIAEMAETTRAALPEPFRAHAQTIALCVEDFADEALCQSVDIADPFELTGLYDGIPLTEKSVADQPLQPDTIWLFRRPILDEWAERDGQPLGALVHHIFVHELAHHFGWSDKEIAKIDKWWE